MWWVGGWAWRFTAAPGTETNVERSMQTDCNNHEGDIYQTTPLAENPNGQHIPASTHKDCPTFMDQQATVARPYHPQDRVSPGPTTGTLPIVQNIPRRRTWACIYEYQITIY